MRGGEYADPPERLTVPLERDGWHVASRTLALAYARREWVPPEETLQSWTQLLTWNLDFGRDRYSLDQSQAYYLDALRSACPSVRSRDLSATEGRRLFEWWDAGCYGRAAQHELVLLVEGVLGTHRISYGVRGDLADAERSAWVARLSAARLEGEARSSGSLGAVEQAQQHVWSSEYADAVELLEPLAKLGDPAALELLGRLRVEGWGVPRDPDRARADFEAAAQAGHAEATFDLARLYDEARGVERDPERALELYRRAAEAGHIDAQARLGVMLAGQARSNDDPLALEAFRWLEGATSQGHAHARYWLATLEERGLGTERDLARALRLYRQAAIDGEPDAQLRLGDLYARGVGVPRNDPEAVKWLIRAAMQGKQEARELYQRIYGRRG